MAGNFPDITRFYLDETARRATRVVDGLRASDAGAAP